MPKVEVRFTAAALEHIERIADYHLRMVGPASAEKITDKLLDAFEILAEHPQAGVKHPDPVLERHGYRKLICGDYVGVYRQVENVVIIYGVFHGSTNYPALFQ